jgi:HAD superfamily hydrolase (TIGR01509 family)
LKCIALDAMGVIYPVGDDVKDLLYPFIMEKGGAVDYSHIRDRYIEASLGRMSAADFWRSVGVDPSLEDEYLNRHRLNPDLVEFLDEFSARGRELWCLSNDVAEWSQKLRIMHRLEEYFRGFIISGETGLRKPDRRIYELLLARTKCKAGEILFVDDNINNLNAAAELGLITILFDPLRKGDTTDHKIVNGFTELLRLIG